LLLAVTACTDSVESEAPAEPATATTTIASSADESLLTPADVEPLTGMTGLASVAYDPASGKEGDVNIVDPAGQVVAMLVEDTPEAWDAWLTDGYTVAESVTPPVGDESFVGPSPDASPVLTLFGFRKGESAVTIETTVDANGEPLLSTEQLRALAEVVAARL
jgi:hypothetical protein